MRKASLITVSAVAIFFVLAVGAAHAEPPPGCEVARAHVIDPWPYSGLGFSAYRCANDTWIISLEALAAYDEHGKPFWTVLDSIEVRKLGPFDEIESGTCAHDGVFDPDLVAVGYRASPHLIRDVYRAWSIDRSAGRLRPTTSDGITCEPYFPDGHEDEWYALRGDTQWRGREHGI